MSAMTCLLPSTRHPKKGLNRISQKWLTTGGEGVREGEGTKSLRTSKMHTSTRSVKFRMDVRENFCMSAKVTDFLHAARPHTHAHMPCTDKWDGV